MSYKYKTEKEVCLTIILHFDILLSSLNENNEKLWR